MTYQPVKKTRYLSYIQHSETKHIPISTLLTHETAEQVCKFLNSDRPIRAELPVSMPKPLGGDER